MPYPLEALMHLPVFSLLKQQKHVEHSCFYSDTVGVRFHMQVFSSRPSLVT